MVFKAKSTVPSNQNSRMNGMPGIVSGYKALDLVSIGETIRILTDSDTVIHATVNKVEEW